VPTAPTWIALSGLPGFLREKTKGSAAWLVLQDLIQLDCATNSLTGNTVELSLDDLAIRTGLTADEARKAAQALSKLKLVPSFLPAGEGEKALFKIATPLPTPLPHSANPIGVHRYCDCAEAEAAAPPDSKFQEVIDLYFNQCSLAINQFKLDQLQLIAGSYDIALIRRVFRWAEKNEVRSLGLIQRELIRWKQKDEAKAEATAPKERTW